MLSVGGGGGGLIGSLRSCGSKLGLNQPYKFRPGYNQVHLVEEHTFAGALGDKLKSGGGKADLFHIRLTSRHLIGCQGFSECP